MLVNLRTTSRRHGLAHVDAFLSYQLFKVRQKDLSRREYTGVSTFSCDHTISVVGIIYALLNYSSVKLDVYASSWTRSEAYTQPRPQGLLLNDFEKWRRPWGRGWAYPNLHRSAKGTGLRMNKLIQSQRRITLSSKLKLSIDSNSFYFFR